MREDLSLHLQPVGASSQCACRRPQEAQRRGADENELPKKVQFAYLMFPTDGSSPDAPTHKIFNGEHWSHHRNCG